MYPGRLVEAPTLVAYDTVDASAVGFLASGWGFHVDELGRMSPPGPLMPPVVQKANRGARVGSLAGCARADAAPTWGHGLARKRGRPRPSQPSGKPKGSQSRSS